MKRIGTSGKICVFCASSDQTDRVYQDDARELGRNLARNHKTVVYGGGSIGSMGALADGALEEGGRVIGVIPKFMVELEWAHTGVSRLDIVDDMHERKRKMLEETDAVVALPGGTGTFEELFETLTLKRLGLYCQPIVMVNTNDFFDPLRDMLERCIVGRFMREMHRDMWAFVEGPDDVLPAIANSLPWSPENRTLAALGKDEG